MLAIGTVHIQDQDQERRDMIMKAIEPDSDDDDDDVASPNIALKQMIEKTQRNVLVRSTRSDSAGTRGASFKTGFHTFLRANYLVVQ